MKRVFALDVLLCPCGGSRRLLAVIPRPEVILAILRCLELAPLHPARGPPGDPAIVLDPDPPIDPIEPGATPTHDPTARRTRLIVD